MSKKLTIEIVTKETTTVEIDVPADYRIRIGDIKRRIREGRYHTISHTVVPNRDYIIIEEVAV